MRPIPLFRQRTVIPAGQTIGTRARDTNPMPILFIRHAESSSNAGGVTLPHAEIPLTDRGHQQAFHLARSLRIRPASVMVSGMLRTHQTAAPFCKRHAITPIVDCRLNEFSLIDHRLIEGMDGTQRRAFTAGYWDNADPHFRWGEEADTFAEFAERVSQFIWSLHMLFEGT